MSTFPNETWDSFVGGMNENEPRLKPDFLPLFKDFLHLSEKEIIDLIVKAKELEGTGASKLGIRGYVNSQNIDVPASFYEKLTSRPLDNSLAELGCSLKIDNVHILSKKAQKMGALLFNNYGIPLSINMYVTPSPETPCFSHPHGDPPQVYIYQIWGNKTWMFYSDKSGQFLKAPDDKQVVIAEKETDLHELSLREGEILHIPPMMIHRARVVEGASIHLTVSLNRSRVDHFLRILEEAVLEVIGTEKYRNLSDGEFELLFEDTIQKLEQDRLKAILKNKKDQFMFFSKLQILTNGR